MKAENLCGVSVKRACQTTHSIDGVRPWGNRLKTLDICRRDQVWVGDITYVRLKGHFVYVALLMDVFTRMIRGWQLSQHLTQSLTLTPLQQALCQSVPEIHPSDQGVQYLSRAYTSTLTRHGIEISLAQRGRPWENGYAQRLIRTLKEEESMTMRILLKPERDHILSHCIIRVKNFEFPHSEDTVRVSDTKYNTTSKHKTWLNSSIPLLIFGL